MTFRHYFRDIGFSALITLRFSSAHHYAAAITPPLAFIDLRFHEGFRHIISSFDISSLRLIDSTRQFLARRALLRRLRAAYGKS
jgi:hypothetical protein